MRGLGAKPLVLALDAPLPNYTAAVDGAVSVYYCSGYSAPMAGPDAPPVPQEEQEAGNRAEHDGTLKVFDAIEAAKGSKPMLIMLSGVDIRDLDKVPAHYVREMEQSTLHSPTTWLTFSPSLM